MPLARQIYERLLMAIDTGVLAPGVRVASARTLASELGVARGTVEAAYQRLAGEGYLLARGPAGTIVSPHLPRAPRAGRASAPAPVGRATITSKPKRLASLASQAQSPLPLQLGIPALDAFPRKVWARLAARRVRTSSIADLGYGDPCGEPALRQAIAAYLLVSRGVPCSADQVFVTTGYCASLTLAASVLLRRGETVWIEDPGYPLTRTVLESGSWIAHPVPVDADGLNDAAGREGAPHARMAVVTPSHQAPLCVSMTVARRLALLDWASHAKAWIFEDDYDGEFHYAGPTLPALKSLDARDRVVYAGSFSKVLFPALSLGYVVAPKATAPAFERALRAAPSRGSRLLQETVAELLTAGHFARHLKKMRLLYARRRAWLVQALREALGERLEVDPTRGGMHLVVRIRARVGDRTLARRAQKAGFACQALSERYATTALRRRSHGLLMGFTNVGSPAQAREIARGLRAAFAIE
ncbi:PLP-dependent aminotransferase family protein [Trinickia sp. Y13]|uniref:MocR-like pyridoxine biosynthesis transcription factor PdxR n=1 Tax=Trinickia sp. Y13 TaxID=2917807 RepID=UPI0024059C83|nr:PLP-dependent aminotransferase family protein [Trinickia sp. Y13]MDG0025063.1 PLP-dependent aminotransferase family protein [Trinickia sp. Y13]